MRKTTPGAALALAWFLAAGSLRAAPAATEDARQREARALHARGLEDFRAARYDRAIEAFQAAYALSPAPGLLYNIAETYRVKGKGSCDAAVTSYRRYRDAE